MDLVSVWVKLFIRIRMGCVLTMLSICCLIVDSGCFARLVKLLWVAVKSLGKLCWLQPHLRFELWFDFHHFAPMSANARNHKMDTKIRDFFVSSTFGHFVLCCRCLRKQHTNRVSGDSKFKFIRCCEKVPHRPFSCLWTIFTKKNRRDICSSIKLPLCWPCNTGIQTDVEMDEPGTKTSTTPNFTT